MSGPQFAIYIPSKGRAETCSTPRLLMEEGIPFTLVVEPQDHDAYCKEFPNTSISVLSENDRGLAYARSGAKDVSMERGEEWHWQFDDDLQALLRRTDNKNVPARPRGILREVEDYVTEYDNIGLAGLCQEVYAGAKPRPLRYNGQCSSFVLVRNNQLRWRDGVIEDTDYSLQVLSSGLCTVQFNRLVYSVPRTGSMTGGLTPSHLSAKRVELSKGLQQAWPGAFKIRIDKKGVARIRPSQVWRKFPQRPGQMGLFQESRP